MKLDLIRYKLDARVVDGVMEAPKLMVDPNGIIVLWPDVQALLADVPPPRLQYEDRSRDDDRPEKGSVVGRDPSEPARPTAGMNEGTGLEGTTGKPSSGEPRLPATSSVSPVVEALGPEAGLEPADPHQLKGVPPPPPSGWQPIETAPRNGRWILAWMRSPWSHHEQIRWLHGNEDLPESRWQTIGDHSAYTEEQFTHWMPLPAPPRDQEKETP